MICLCVCLFTPQRVDGANELVVDSASSLGINTCAGTYATQALKAFVHRCQTPFFSGRGQAAVVGFMDAFLGQLCSISRHNPRKIASVTGRAWLWGYLEYCTCVGALPNVLSVIKFSLEGEVEWHVVAHSAVSDYLQNVKQMEKLVFGDCAVWLEKLTI